MVLRPSLLAIYMLSCTIPIAPTQPTVHRLALHVQSQSQDQSPPTVSGPLTGFPVSSAHGTMTLHITTYAASPWNDVEWLRRMPKYNGDNNIRIRVIRAHGGGYCIMDTITVPAAPNRQVDYSLDLGKVSDGDSVMFEDWPGYRIQTWDSYISGDVRKFPEDFGEKRTEIKATCPN